MKNRAIILMIIVAVLAGCGGPDSIGNDPPIVELLAAPENVMVFRDGPDLAVFWDAVTEATSYAVYCLTEQEYDVDGFLPVDSLTDYESINYSWWQQTGSETTFDNMSSGHYFIAVVALSPTNYSPVSDATDIWVP
jgi:hypothetical protein